LAPAAAVLVTTAKRRASTRIAPDELAREPEEGLFEVVVALGGDVVVLDVLAAVEADVLGLHLAILAVQVLIQ
jgi:hypothetical protein